MKYPKKLRIYCPKCNKHTEHSVEQSKHHTRRKVAKGQRRFLRKMKGYHSFPKENPKGREKPTRRTDLRFKCAVCGQKHIHGSGFRSKKFEITAKGSKESKQPKAVKGPKPQEDSGKKKKK
jgi:large subunit ribosomal protein L44e